MFRDRRENAVSESDQSVIQIWRVAWLVETVSEIPRDVFRLLLRIMSYAAIHNDLCEPVCHLADCTIHVVCLILRYSQYPHLLMQEVNCSWMPYQNSLQYIQLFAVLFLKEWHVLTKNEEYPLLYHSSILRFLQSPNLLCYIQRMSMVPFLW